MFSPNSCLAVAYARNLKDKSQENSCHSVETIGPFLGYQRWVQGLKLFESSSTSCAILNQGKERLKRSSSGNNGRVSVSVKWVSFNDLPRATYKMCTRSH